MRVTSAGSCETILCNWLAVLLGSSTVVTILAVTSGSVAIVVTFLIASATNTLGSSVLGSTGLLLSVLAAGEGGIVEVFGPGRVAVAIVVCTSLSPRSIEPGGGRLEVWRVRETPGKKRGGRQ